MQRDYQGQDGRMAYKEQVAIDENNNLDYRSTYGGNCVYGDWGDWEGEKAALRFIFGDLPISQGLVKKLKSDLKKARELKEDEFNMNCY